MFKKQLAFPQVRVVPVVGLGHSGFYHVESRKEPGKFYLVNLLAFRGNGDCECGDFLHKFEARLERGEALSDYTRCFHIVAARLFMADEVVRVLMRNDNAMRITILNRQ